MNFSRIDIFSSPFQFDFGNQVKRKGTVYGAILSLVLIAIMITYSAYLFYLYFSNQINPNYASQSFVADDTIDIELFKELVGFRYEYGANLILDDLQAQKNKTYLVFAPYFYYQIGTYYQMIPLNYTKCTAPQLQGFNCLDFSTVKNYTLTLSTSQNFFSNIYLFVYRCQDTDLYNSYIPDNCVQDDVDYNSIINNPQADLRLKLYTSQYNTTSQKVQINYRSSYAYLQGNQFNYYDYKIQKQITNIKQGSIIQTQSSFSSPISYDVKTITTDRQSFVLSTNQTCYMQINLEVDEIVQHIQIQYATLAQIISQCNSVLALLMCIGLLGRKFALKLMREDIFLLLLQNLFHGTYQAILRKNNILSEKNDFCHSLEIRQSQIKVGEKDQILEQEDQIEKNDAIFIPSFLTKSIQLVDNQNNLEQQNENLITEIQNTCQDEVIEFEANKVYEINHEKRGDQKQIQIPDSPLIQNFSVEIQNFNSQPTNAHKKSEIIKDSLFLESIQPGVQIKNDYNDSSKQGAISCTLANRDIFRIYEITKQSSVKQLTKK